MENCFCSQPSLPTHNPKFFSCFHYTFVMPCAPRTCLIIFLSLRGYGQTLTSHLVLARSCGRLCPLRGEQGGRPQPHCGCAPLSAPGSPAPPHAWRGRASDPHGLFSVVKCVLLGSELKDRNTSDHALAAPTKFISLNQVRAVACIIFLKRKCA